MLLQLGASAGAVEKWIPSSGPKITSDVHGNSGDFGHLGEKLCRQQLLPGEELETLQAVLLDNIHVSTQWSKISDKIIQSFTQDTKTVSLLGWCREILLDAATRSFFDECLVKIDSHLYDSFFIFDELSWKLHFRYPRVLSKEMYAAKDRIIDALKIYFELPKSERKGESWLISNLETAMRDVGIETEDVAALIMPLYWVINANAYKSCFWTMAHILFDPGLLVTIRKEVDAVFAEGTANLEARLESCPMLEAVYLEALRLTSASGTIRNVRHTTELGDVTLQQGTNIVVPYRQLHYNETVFGPEPDQFHPERFLHNKELKRSPSFKPFGGGHTYCPGRFLARREVLSFVADLIHRFDLTLTSVGTGCAAKADTSGQRFPRMNTKKIALALIDPVFGDDLLVDVRERQI
ncbi:hypothetical protein MMC26_007611 [Xylographa opegraphella]|nr:hypothetical protein [Xylographa opegraphella]